jgi:hypothetical protein
MVETHALGGVRSGLAGTRATVVQHDIAVRPFDDPDVHWQVYEGPVPTIRHECSEGHAHEPTSDCRF